MAHRIIFVFISRTITRIAEMRMVELFLFVRDFSLQTLPKDSMTYNDLRCEPRWIASHKEAKTETIFTCLADLCDIVDSRFIVGKSGKLIFNHRLIDRTISQPNNQIIKKFIRACSATWCFGENHNFRNHRLKTIRGVRQKIGGF